MKIVDHWLSIDPEKPDKKNEKFSLKKLKIILKFSKESKRLKSLIDYIRLMDDDNINLEDLTDIIDDTSQETDAFI